MSKSRVITIIVVGVISLAFLIYWFLSGYSSLLWSSGFSAGIAFALFVG